eukprot:scaffold274_cov78-Skeletonema_dohrnii-CCMP3373.AAC.1
MEEKWQVARGERWKQKRGIEGLKGIALQRKVQNSRGNSKSRSRWGGLSQERKSPPNRHHYLLCSRSSWPAAGVEAGAAAAGVGSAAVAAKVKAAATGIGAAAGAVWTCG